MTKSNKRNNAVKKATASSTQLVATGTLVPSSQMLANVGFSTSVFTLGFPDLIVDRVLLINDQNKIFSKYILGKKIRHSRHTLAIFLDERGARHFVFELCGYVIKDEIAHIQMQQQVNMKRTQHNHPWYIVHLDFPVISVGGGNFAKA